MRIGLIEFVVIGLTALLIFGTRRLSKVKESFKKAANEFKDNMDNKV